MILSEKTVSVFNFKLLKRTWMLVPFPYRHNLSSITQFYLTSPKWSPLILLCTEELPCFYWSTSQIWQNLLFLLGDHRHWLIANKLILACKGLLSFMIHHNTIRLISYCLNPTWHTSTRTSCNDKPKYDWLVHVKEDVSAPVTISLDAGLLCAGHIQIIVREPRLFLHVIDITDVMSCTSNTDL